MKKYYLTSFWKNYSLLSVIIFFWIILGTIAFLGKNFLFALLLFFIGLAITLLGIYEIRTTHIVISKIGIEWHTFGGNSWAKWENAEKISYRVYGFSIPEGIYFKKLFVRINKKDYGHFPNIYSQPPIKPFLPLSYFSDNWRDAELGQQIKQYAPHLFQ